MNKMMSKDNSYSSRPLSKSTWILNAVCILSVMAFVTSCQQSHRRAQPDPQRIVTEKPITRVTAPPKRVVEVPTQSRRRRSVVSGDWSDVLGDDAAPHPRRASYSAPRRVSQPQPKVIEEVFCSRSCLNKTALWVSFENPVKGICFVNKIC